MMFNSAHKCVRMTALCGLILINFGSLDYALAGYNFSSLYSFKGGSDGQGPASAILLDASGNIYGTTEDGGGSGKGCLFGYGCGTVFKLTSTGSETPLYSFKGGNDGEIPYGALIADASGNLYGTTAFGGSYGNGTVFQITPDGTENVLHVFSNGGGDGSNPYAGLVADGVGNLYGTTTGGGAFASGTIFEVGSDDTETVLYSFTGGRDGSVPYDPLILDRKGRLYGTTVGGGAWNQGAVFMLGPTGTESVLYSFHGAAKHGAQPFSKLVRDKSGNFYGTTYAGGSDNLGAVFKVAPDGTETILYSFKGGTDGANPTRSLVMDSDNNLYGTTTWGGSGNCYQGCGIVFKLTQQKRETILHSFGGEDGATPTAGLTLDGSGNLYGTTDGGGTNQLGTVFKLSKS